MMLKNIVLLILFSAFPLLGLCQELVENDPNSPDGLVYFLRGKNHAWSYLAFSAIVDGNRVCKLNNRRYASYLVEPGIHSFKVQVGGKKGKKKAEITEITIEAGKTHYIQMIMHTNYWWTNVYPQEITRNGAMRLLQTDKLKLDPYCGEEIGKEAQSDVLQ